MEYGGGELESSNSKFLIEDLIMELRIQVMN